MRNNSENKTDFSEKYILEQLKKGENSAFRFIFDNYYNSLAMIAKSYIKDSFTAETIVDDVIFNLWKIREQLEISYNLRSYLIRSVRNRCINYLQQEYVRRETGFNLQEDKEAIEELYFIDERHPMEELMGKELEIVIEQSIFALPAECRDVFKMSRFENMKYEEIAEKLNISINTVKYHMKNALMRLRLDLKDYIVSIFILIDFISGNFK